MGKLFLFDISCNPNQVVFYDSQISISSEMTVPIINRNNAILLIDNIRKRLRLPGDFSMESISTVKRKEYFFWEGKYIWINGEYKHMDSGITIAISPYSGELMLYTMDGIPNDNVVHL